MNLSYTVDYDPKNDRYEIDYRGHCTIQSVNVGGRAMEELAGTGQINVSMQNDIGAAIAEYLDSKSIASTKEEPVFILPEADMGTVRNAIPVTAELREVCQKYLDE